MQYLVRHYSDFAHEGRGETIDKEVCGVIFVGAEDSVILLLGGSRCGNLSFWLAFIIVVKVTLSGRARERGPKMGDGSCGVAGPSTVAQCYGEGEYVFHFFIMGR